MDGQNTLGKFKECKENSLQCSLEILYKADNYKSL